jgi:hypothetical protein
MKKIKLMLVSLSVLAVVGGALAFSAKSGSFYCTANTILDAHNNVTCPAACPNKAKIKIGAASDNVCTTTLGTDPLNPCPSTLQCFQTNPGSTKE